MTQTATLSLALPRGETARSAPALPARVAVLTPYQPSGRPGGVEVFCTQLQAALGRVETFGAATGLEAPRPSLSLLGLEQPYRALRLSRNFLERHRREPFDLILSNGITGWPLSLAALPTPQVQVYHFTLAGLARSALPLASDRAITGRVGGWFDRAAGVGKTVVAVSESVRREVWDRYGHQATVIPNGVDVRLFRRGDRSAARERLRLRPDAAVGVFVGRSEYAKGFDLLLEVARRMKEVTFLAASRPQAAPDNVRFLTDVPHDGMPEVYSAADFFLLPSRYEGFNLSLLEALACDLPAVVSREAYPFGDRAPALGHIVDSLTPDAFVAAVREALDRGPIAGVRRRIEEGYSLEVFRRNWRSLVTAVLDGRIDTAGTRH